MAESALVSPVLCADFGPGSDIDVLVAFTPEARWSLFDRARMQGEPEEIFGRRVDLVGREIG